MTNNISSILKRVKEIEKNLQELKVDLLFRLPKKELKIYPLEDILKEIKKTRKKLWNEKYSKTI
jgi:transposase